jgi:putative ABC transport system permease protein
VPGVGDASYINHLPIAGDRWGFGFQVEGRPSANPRSGPTAAYRVVYPGYFRAMHIPLLRGRDFAESDRLDAPRVVVINEFMAKTYWPNEDAIGKRITIGDSTLVTVVGVAKNTVRERWTGPSEEELFVPFFQEQSYLSGMGGHVAYLTLVARTTCTGRSTCAAASLASPIAAAIRGVDRSVVIADVKTMSSVVDHATAESQFYVALLSVFAAIALTLAAVGIYGVMSYTVSRRTNEIGIRIALGADPSGVVRYIVGGGIRLALAGAAVGLVGAFALTRLMDKLLYGVGATDPVTFLAVPLVLCAVALVASYLPARRAAKVDPLTALRAD